jgi:hypothetical protein
MFTIEEKRIYNKKYWEKNKEKEKERGKKYYETHKEEIRTRRKIRGTHTYQRRYNLKYNFGMTMEEYNRMFEEQKGCCIICGIHQSKLKRALSVDHNHSTKKIRSLLCGNCNHMLGHAHEDIEILQKAIEYLEQYSEK